MPTSDFWRYEWNKHGKCAAVLENLLTLKDYFKFTVKSAEEFDRDIYQPLKNEFKPSNTDTLNAEAFKLSIENLYGYKIHLKCWGSYINSVEICYDLELKQLDCPINYHSRCGASEVSLPT